jgi:branched-chain amino acid transport system ATP-binding protein
MSLLTARIIDAAYGDLHVLRNISIQVEKGSIVIILGANGAGKSTLLRSISGQVKNIEGSINFRGNELVGLNAPDIVNYGVSHVPEGRRLFPFLSVEDNLRLGAYRLKNKQDISKNLTMIFDLFPTLMTRKGQMAGSLSGGEQQMCAIGRGLMSSPDLLLLDEPSLGLAPLLVAHLFEKIQEIQSQGITVLLAEQSVKHALHISDYAYILESGKIVTEGTAENIMRSRRVEKAYLGF